MKKYTFDDYQIVTYQTNKGFWGKLPSQRYVAYILEIPEASLHEYGRTRIEAINKLEMLFDDFMETQWKGLVLPKPARCE